MHHIYAYRLFRRLGRFGCVFLLLSLAGCFGTWCIWRASVFAFLPLVVTPNCSKKGVDFGMCCSRIGFNDQGPYQFVELQIRHSLFIFFWKIYFNIVETKMLCNCFSLWLFFLKKMSYKLKYFYIVSNSGHSPWTYSSSQGVLDGPTNKIHLLPCFHQHLHLSRQKESLCLRLHLTSLNPVHRPKHFHLPVEYQDVTIIKNNNPCLSKVY